MRPSRLVPIVALLAAGAITAAPAVAFAARPAAKPTHLTIHAGKDHPAPKSHDPFTVHLNSRHQGISGETANLSLWERTAKSSGHGTEWADVTADGTVTDNGDGSYTVSGITPNDPHAKTGHKDQFQVRFAGDSTYQHSHSSVITVVVRPAG
jgi:hypothetical protein